MGTEQRLCNLGLNAVEGHIRRPPGRGHKASKEPVGAPWSQPLCLSLGEWPVGRPVFLTRSTAPVLQLSHTRGPKHWPSRRHHSAPVPVAEGASCPWVSKKITQTGSSLSLSSKGSALHWAFLAWGLLCPQRSSHYRRGLQQLAFAGRPQEGDHRGMGPGARAEGPRGVPGHPGSCPKMCHVREASLSRVEGRAQEDWRVVWETSSRFSKWERGENAHGVGVEIWGGKTEWL